MDHSQPKRVSRHLASLSAEFKHGTATRLSVCLVLDLAAAPPSGSLLKKATQGLELHVRSASTEAICHRLGVEGGGPFDEIGSVLLKGGRKV